MVNKYFDHKENQPIIIELDGIEISSWKDNQHNKKFAWHPLGFKVFLNYEQIYKNDEYLETDPYSVETKLDSEFHQRRIKTTVKLSKRVEELIGKPLKILDLGCGEGHITQQIKSELFDAEISALDYSLTAIEYAYAKFENIDFIVGNAYNMPYANEYFDLVICNNIYEHVIDPNHLVNQIKRILKPKGYLIISTPSRYRLGNLIRVILGKSVTLMSNKHVTEYTVGQIKEQMEFSNLKVVDISNEEINCGSLKFRILYKILSSIIKRLNSHHSLDETVFYLIKK